MDNREVIESLESIIKQIRKGDGFCDVLVTGKDKEALLLSKKATEKQIPKMTILKEEEHFSYGIGKMTFIEPHCPICDAETPRDNGDEFCANCGQALLFEED